MLCASSRSQHDGQYAQVRGLVFGIISVDCAKARSKWMLADFYAKVLAPPTEVARKCVLWVNTWLMVFVFESNKPQDKLKGKEPKPFRFRLVVCAKVIKEDWKFSGRSETSRRTITASISKSGYEKMFKNWIYKATD